MLKNQGYPQKLMFTATGGPTDMPLVVTSRGYGVVTCNAAVNLPKNAFDTLK
jgi:hypothetical protein